MTPSNHTAQSQPLFHVAVNNIVSP